MRPFVFLGIRADDVAADQEYAAVLRCTGLDERQLLRVRLEKSPLDSLDLDKCSGIILGGGPYQVSDPEPAKSPTQRRVEAELAALLDLVVQRDFPFLGCCYGIGTLGKHEGAVVDRTFGEPLGGAFIELTPEGRHDRLLGVAGSPFGAYLGHKEAIRKLPPHAVVLASSPSCPVQAFRVGANVYATQFHPELDLAGLAVRIQIYRHAGYFPPDQADAVLAAAQASGVTGIPNLLGRFVELFARP